MASKYLSYKLCIVVFGLALISVVLQPKQVECQEDSEEGSSAAAAAAASGGSRSDISGDTSIKELEVKKKLIHHLVRCVSELVKNIMTGSTTIPDVCCKIKFFDKIPECKKSSASTSPPKKKKKKKKAAAKKEHEEEDWAEV